MDLTADFKSYQDEVTSSLRDVVRSASQVSNHDLSFHRSASDRLSRKLDAQSSHLLRLTSKLLKAATKNTNVRAPELKTLEDVDDNWRGIVDVVDDLLEKADASLDEFNGVIKRLSPAVQTPETPKVQDTLRKKGQFAWTGVVAEKPQLHFERKVDNYDTAPFKPLLRSKPHAIVPLDESLGDGNPQFNHPYAAEIEASTYPSHIYSRSAPAPYSDPSASQAIFVDTEEGVREMLNELRQATEIAVDLEHNERNSFIGMVSLMQISTREKDWIVDTLKPWRENLQMLNEVFADPKIVKVFHGSSMDMIWLQRDLGLYVVGLFDTYHAGLALRFPKLSLAYLLERFVNVKAQKQYQTADWRVRPLPSELIDYARSDTHYLLYIYDQLRHMLMQASTPNQDLLLEVLAGSKKEALQIYQRPSVYDAENGLGPGGWFNLLMQRVVRFNNEQFGVFRALHQWRDQKAREWDEGCSFVLTNNQLWHIAEFMPEHQAALWTCVRPMSKPLSDNWREVIQLVHRARKAGAQGPSVRDVIKKNENDPAYVKKFNWKKQREQDNSHRGVGATLQLLAQNGQKSQPQTPAPSYDGSVDGPVTAQTSTSQFWGNVPAFADSAVPNMDAAQFALQMVMPLLNNFASLLPLPTDTAAGASADIPQLMPTTNGVPRSSLERKADVVDVPEESVISLSEAGEIEDSTGEAVDEPETMTPDPHERAREAKRQRKAERKASKAAAKAVAATTPVVPFDYENAESLLNTTPTSASVKTTTKAMNPFAKSLDTSTGARRNKMSKELPGRSHTFK